MKAKFTYILFASALLLSSACQKEYANMEDSKNLSFSVSLADAGTKADTKSSNVVFSDENGNPAPFTINLSVEDTKVEPLTKGIPITNKTDFKNQVEEFKAWGWYGDKSWDGISGAKIKKYEGGDEYRPYENGEFINAYNSAATAVRDYHFYAHYPYDLSSPSSTGATLTSGPTIADGMTFSYTSPGGTGGTEDAVLQKEVLAGYLGTGANMASVPITFTPILAAIRFQVGEHMDHDITIKSIELKNFYYTGSCVVKAGADPVVKWTTTTTSKRNFKQDFNKAIQTTDSGMEINADDLSKTFFVVPQTCSSEMGSGGALNGGMIIINYTETDEHGVEGTEKPAQHLVFGNKFEAGKTYIYKIGKFDDDPDDLEPWVEFSNFQVNLPGLLGTTNEIHEENNSKFIFNFAQQNGYGEKAYFNIYNLEVGHWYSIDFTERATLYNNDGNVVSQTFNTSGQGCYACSVVYKPGNKENTERAYGDQLIYQNNLNPETFIWEHPDDIYDTKTYNPFYTDKDHYKTARITFKATQPTMQWEWDFSSGQDGNVLRSEIYLVGDKIKDITPEQNVPTIDFQESILYNFKKNNDWDSYSSMKTYAVDATAGSDPATGEFFIRVVNGGNGRINIPLTNLDNGQKYRIRYKIEKSGTRASQGNGYYVGSSVLASQKNAGDARYKPLFDLSSTFSSNASISDDEFREIQFTATGDEMFWVWELSKFGTGNGDHQFITLKDVTIEEIAAADFKYLDENGVDQGKGISIVESVGGVEKTVFWAPVNVGYSNSYTYGKLYQWGRVAGQGYGSPDEAGTTVTFNNNKTNTPADNTFYRNQTDWKTAANAINVAWNDIEETAYIGNPCPPGWRIPTSEELVGLTANATWTDDRKGLYLKGNNSSLSDANSVFLPAAGFRIGTGTSGTCSDRGTVGYYWTSDNIGTPSGRYLQFDKDGVNDISTSTSNRSNGYSIRCVLE